MMEVRFDDHVLCYEIGGVGQRTFVFVHGWMSNHTFLQPQFEHFAAHATVIGLDLRGHGRSTSPPVTLTSHTVAAFADDVLAVISDAGASAPIVVGHSLGGLVALECGVRGVAAAVVMIDPPPIVNARARQHIRDKIDDADRDVDGSWRRRTVDATFVATDTVRRLEIVDSAGSAPLDISAATFAAISSYDGITALGRVAVPIALIGSDTAADPPRDLRRACPTIRVARTLGAGHFNQLEVPDQVNAMIERFVHLSFG